MTAKHYLMVRENVVTNICIWDGNVNTWTPPSNTTMLVQETTPTKIWGLNEDKSDYVLLNSSGDACIGFTYDGFTCTTNEVKPEKPIIVEPRALDGEIPSTEFK